MASHWLFIMGQEKALTSSIFLRLDKQIRASMGKGFTLQKTQTNQVGMPEQMR